MKCPECQFENPEDSTICGKCGLSLEAMCPNCGAKPPARFDFYKRCGHEPHKSKQVHPVDYSEPQSYTPKHLADKILTTNSSIEGDRKRDYFHFESKSKV